MNTVRETAFDLLWNAFVQIGLFSIVAAAFSGLVAKARAKYQHVFYLAVFLFCVAVPVVNTVWQSHSIARAERSLQQVIPQIGQHDRGFWGWQGDSGQKRELTPGPDVQHWVLALWGAFVFYRLVHFSRGVYRVHRLRKDASVLSWAQVGVARELIEGKHAITILQSKAIDDPVTVGVFRPAILLPSKVLSDLSEEDLSAIVAHEYGHIRRRDFLAHVLCELISLPVAWHPGIRYLKSRISRTGELACDDYAAVRLGKRRLYARSLIRLASLCLQTPRGNAGGLGIFDGDNLETRIMMLTEKRRSLSRAGLIGLALAMSIPLGTSAMLGHAMSLQAGSASSNIAESFAGTWQWMFNGKSFSTMILVRDGSGFTGTVTPSRIALDDDGALVRADPSENSTPTPVTKAKLEGSGLDVTVEDGDQPFEFIMTLRDGTHAEIHPKGAPPNMKPIPAEKVH